MSCQVSFFGGSLKKHLQSKIKEIRLDLLNSKKKERNMKKYSLLLVAGLALLTSACANLCEPDCGAKPCQKGEVIYTTTSSLFDFDSAQLDATDEAALTSAAERLNAESNAGKTVTANGYASMEGPASYNVDLSRRRAEAVKGYLVKKGVCPKRISVKANGATNMFGPAPQNRRVEIVVD